MARNYAPAFNFNVHMDEDHFPPLGMLHAQQAQQAEQRQMAAAMKASKKAYDAQKAMLDIETKAVSPATTVGYFSSDDARSGLSSDGNESSSSKTSRKPQKKGGKFKSGKGGKSKGSKGQKGDEAAPVAGAGAAAAAAAAGSEEAAGTMRQSYTGRVESEPSPARRRN